MNIKEFAVLLENQQRDRMIKNCPNTPPNCIDLNAKVTVIPGRKYTKVDVGTSGKYMIDQDGNIYGVKAYGVIHKGHCYGTLDTVDSWDWGGYTATPYPPRKLL